MFSLPNIKSLHDRAVKERAETEKKHTFTCDCCGNEFKPKKCREEGREYMIEEWHDSLSEGTKGILHVCPDCYENNGTPEGFFECNHCGKLHIENYSWERYETIIDDEPCCLPCAAKIHLAEGSDAWMKTRKEIMRRTASPEAAQDMVKHLSAIGSEYGLPEGCKSFRDTEEYEAEGLNWFNEMEVGGFSGGGAMTEIRENALTAFRFYREVTVIIAEAGQFQAYCDIVVREDSRRKRPLKARAA